MKKKCNKCGEDKDINRFSKTNRTTDGYLGTCKDCINKKSNQRYHEIQNGTYFKKQIIKFNDTYFENIDTEDKSYWLGFFYADGYVRKRHDSGQFKLKLCKKDKNHIELFKTNIKSEHIITDGVEFFTKNNKKYKSEYSLLNIYSLKLVDDLIKHGCVQNKTQKIRFPILKNELIQHFIRGYFDGDGCIYKIKF